MSERGRKYRMEEKEREIDRGIEKAREKNKTADRKEQHIIVSDDKCVLYFVHDFNNQ